MNITYNSNAVPHTMFALATELHTSFLGSRPPGNVPPDPASCCTDCYVLPAMADLSDNDVLKNDRFTVAFEVTTPSDTVDMNLEKYVGGVWVAQDDLNDSTYGDYTALGAHTNPFLMSMVLHWREVLDNFNAGFYRVISKVTTAGSQTDYYSFVFCLQAYSEKKADKTARFEWLMSDRQNDMNNYRFQTDFADAAIPCMLRVGGLFGRLSAEYEDHETKFENGNWEKYRVETTPNFEFKSSRYYGSVHELLMFTVMPNNDLTVTDYCLKNDYRNIERLPVLVTSGYKPGYDTDSTTLSRVSLTFKAKKWDHGRRFSR